MYFIFKPGWLKFGKSSCFKDRTRRHRPQTRLYVNLRCYQNDKTLYHGIYLQTQLWMTGTYLSLCLKLRHSKNLICLQIFLNFLNVFTIDFRDRKRKGERKRRKGREGLREREKERERELEISICHSGT